MSADYPEDLLAREAAPRYAGEGPFALWHFSEDPSLGRFRPRAPAANPAERPLVWALDTRHAPMFWFPRDCPRGLLVVDDMTPLPEWTDSHRAAQEQVRRTLLTAPGLTSVELAHGSGVILGARAS